MSPFTRAGCLPVTLSSTGPRLGREVRYQSRLCTAAWPLGYGQYVIREPVRASSNADRKVGPISPKSTAVRIRFAYTDSSMQIDGQMSAIPQGATELATTRVALEFRERQEAVAQDVSRIKSGMSANGALFSGRTIVLVREAIGREYEVRASIAWNVWARALTATRAEITTALADELKATLRKHLEQDCEDLVGHYQGALNLMRGSAGARMEDLTPLREHAIAKVASEIDFGLREAARPALVGGGAPVFNIYSPVGAIQTGAGSSATVHMSFTEQERGALLDALQSVERAVREAALSESVVAEVSEAIVVARSEAQKVKPNMMTLRGVLAGIGGTIQTLGSATAAYQLLKAAAASIGLHLP